MSEYVALHYLIISLNSPITEAAADFLVHKAAMIENVIGDQRLFVRYVLLFWWSFIVWLNQITMRYQVSAIVHQKTSEKYNKDC